MAWRRARNWWRMLSASPSALRRWLGVRGRGGTERVGGGRRVVGGRWEVLEEEGDNPPRPAATPPEEGTEEEAAAGPPAEGIEEAVAAEAMDGDFGEVGRPFLPVVR